MSLLVRVCMFVWVCLSACLSSFLCVLLCRSSFLPVCDVACLQVPAQLEFHVCFSFLPLFCLCCRVSSSICVYLLVFFWTLQVSLSLDIVCVPVFVVFWPDPCYMDPVYGCLLISISTLCLVHVCPFLCRSPSQCMPVCWLPYVGSLCVFICCSLSHNMSVCQQCAVVW